MAHSRSQISLRAHGLWAESKQWFSFYCFSLKLLFTERIWRKSESGIREKQISCGRQDSSQLWSCKYYKFVLKFLVKKLIVFTFLICLLYPTWNPKGFSVFPNAAFSPFPRRETVAPRNRSAVPGEIVHLVKAIVFPVVMCGCESWTVKKAECQRIDAWELWCWRRLLRVPWTARGSNQSILKEINPEYSLTGLMLKLKLQYFGNLMWRTDSLEKTLMLGKIDPEGRKRRGW